MTKLAQYLLAIFIFLLVVAGVLGITNLSFNKKEPQEVDISQAEIKHFSLYFNGNKVDLTRDDLSNGLKLAIKNLDDNFDRIISDFGLKSFPIFELRSFSDFDLYVSDQKLKSPEKDFGTLDSRYPEGSVYQSNIIFFYLPVEMSADPTSDVALIPTHEFVHLVQNRFLNGQSKVPPPWFREGSATYESKMINDTYRTEVKQAKDRGNFFKFNDLIAISGPPDNPTLFYPTVGVFYEYLVKNYTVLKINSIFSSTGDGTEFEKAFVDITTKTPNELYNSWLESL